MTLDDFADTLEAEGFRVDRSDLLGGTDDTLYVTGGGDGRDIGDYKRLEITINADGFWLCEEYEGTTFLTENEFLTDGELLDYLLDR